jgi:hypothetical protein
MAPGPVLFAFTIVAVSDPWNGLTLVSVMLPLPRPVLPPLASASQPPPPLTWTSFTAVTSWLNVYVPGVGVPENAYWNEIVSPFPDALMMSCVPTPSALHEKVPVVPPLSVIEHPAAAPLELELDVELPVVTPPPHAAAQFADSQLVTPAAAASHAGVRSALQLARLPPPHTQLSSVEHGPSAAVICVEQWLWRHCVHVELVAKALQLPPVPPPPLPLQAPMVAIIAATTMYAVFFPKFMIPLQVVGRCVSRRTRAIALGSQGSSTSRRFPARVR